ncbi:MAG: efflux RND transporter periplasmic adaptor subunit [Desulfobaccales bacterium]|jgi:RND family efflux transporter MFP subunit
MNGRKILELSVLVLLALVFMAWLAGLLHFGKISPGLAPLTGAAPPGQVVVVTETPIPRRLEIPGQVISPSLAQISSQVPGKVTKTWVEAGSRVKQGDALITLFAGEYQERLNQALAGVAQARASLAQISADYQRYRILFKEGAASPQEFEAMEARFQSARAALTAAESQAGEAAVLQGYTVIRSPASGVVAERRAAVGDLAQPGQTLVLVYNPDLLQIEGEVSDSYRSQVKVGEELEVAVPSADWRSQVPLGEIFPISQGLSRTFKVRTAVIKDQKLTPGMFARLSLPLQSTPGILIPREAVAAIGQLTMVRVLVAGQAQLLQVKLGQLVGEQVEVLAGLNPGDQVWLPLPEKNDR